MPYRLLPGLLLSLFIIVYTTRPAAAQPVLAGPEDLKVHEALKVEEGLMSAQARSWAAERRLPLHLRQADGRVVTLVGVVAGRPLYLTSLNQFSARVTGTVHLYPGGRLGLGLTGQGLQIGLWDGGHAYRGHQEFGGRVTFGDVARDDGHATHVAGTLIAAGISPEAQGMAYEADLRSYDWDNDAVEMSNEARDGLLVSNHSYGTIAGWFFGDLEGKGKQWYWLGDPAVSSAEDYTFGWYDLEAIQFDRAAYNHPYYLPVVAAGNDREDYGPAGGTYRGLDAQQSWQTYDAATHPHPPDGGLEGYDTISGSALAKNVLTVGAVGQDSPGGAYRPSTFSSFGPADDGRIKPDLVGFGEHVLSTTLVNTQSYGLSSGTSMASPNVTGSLLLLQQHYANLTGRYLRAATLKGLVLHTARDLGTPGPDYQTGWGLLDAEAAARQITGALRNPLAVFEGALEEQDVFVKTITVDSTGPLRVTLSWTDPPGLRLPLEGSTSLDRPTPRLRNDLDLRIIDEETGAVHRPLRLDPAHPAAPAAPGDNVVDPVEQVFVAQVTPGLYRIEVSHKGAIAGSITGTPTQLFSLLVTGGHGDLVPVAVTDLAASATLDGVTINWQTQFEDMDGRFVLERAPVDYPLEGERQVGRFETVGTLTTEGGMDKTRTYEYADLHTLAGRYLYRLAFEAETGRYLTGEVEVNVPPPERFDVVSNYPNPFTDGTTVVLDLPETQQVRVEIFDVLGRRVQLLEDGRLAAGRHELPVDGSSWTPGVYFVRVQTPRGLHTHQIVRMR